MGKFIDKCRKFWYFRLCNPVIRRGEKGGFKWVFRRYWLDLSTVSGNFNARFTAAEHPYGYLLSSKDDSQLEGYCQTLYMVGMLLTTEQKFVNTIGKAINDYDKRMEKSAKVVEDEGEEKVAMEEVKQVQEYVEMEPKERKKMERDVNGRFKKVARNLKEKAEKK